MPSPNKSGLSVISILSELPTIIAGIYTSIHTSSSLLYGVVRSILSSSVVTFHFLFACFKVRKILSLFSASLRRAKLTGEVSFVTASSRCSFVTTPSCACNTAPIIFCRSSRTLPGHVYISNALRSLLNLKIDANLHDIIRIRFYVAHLHLEIGSVRTG